MLITHPAFSLLALLEKGIEIVEERYDGAVQLHEAFHRAVRAESRLAEVLHPDVVEKKVHLFKVRLCPSIPCSFYACVGIQGQNRTPSDNSCV